MKVLFVTPRPPWPTRRGDQARAATLIAALAPRHEIFVVTLRPPGFASCAWPGGVAGSEVRLTWTRAAGNILAHPRQPLQVAMHATGRLAGVLRRVVSALRPDVAVVVLSRLGGVLPALAGLPVVVDLVDSLHLNLQSRAARQPALAALLRWEARRIGRWDRSLARSAACATVVSHRDRADLLAAEPGLERRIAVLPCGVAVSETPPPPPRGSDVVVLSGNLGYFPTVDGALWFAHEVWPVLRRLHPGVQWRLAGARPARAIRRLARLPGITVVAEPDDLAAEIKRAAVMVAPLLSGSGTPNKVLEAMAAGIPVAATPAAASGLDELAGNEITIAADQRQLAQGIANLLANRELAARQAAAAWQYVKRRHSLAAVGRQLEQLLSGVVAAAARS